MQDSRRIRSVSRHQLDPGASELAHHGKESGQSGASRGPVAHGFDPGLERSLRCRGAEVRVCRDPARRIPHGLPFQSGRMRRRREAAHRVQLTGAFEMGKYEVTQAQWTSVMGSIRAISGARPVPVENVSWNEARAFMARLNRRDGPYLYRLPTEAEWEYAARAGASVRTPAILTPSRGTVRTRRSAPTKSGPTRPNAWGLHDMLGNVWEWCSDRYGADYYRESRLRIREALEGELRVMRGGSWYRYMWFHRLPRGSGNDRMPRTAMWAFGASAPGGDISHADVGTLLPTGTGPPRLSQKWRTARRSGRDPPSGPALLVRLPSRSPGIPGPLELSALGYNEPRSDRRKALVRRSRASEGLKWAAKTPRE